MQFLGACFWVLADFDRKCVLREMEITSDEKPDILGQPLSHCGFCHEEGFVITSLEFTRLHTGYWRVWYRATDGP